VTSKAWPGACGRGVPIVVCLLSVGNLPTVEEQPLNVGLSSQRKSNRSTAAAAIRRDHFRGICLPCMTK